MASGEGEAPWRPRLKSASPGNLEAVGASVLGGRLFAEEDGNAAVPKIVITRLVARRYFGQANPVGSYMDWHGVKKGESARFEVIGVIDDIRQARLDCEMWPEIFVDYRHLIRVLERWGEEPLVVNHLTFGFQSFAVARPVTRAIWFQSCGRPYGMSM
jgi:hypothetical protein